ncbi:MAG: OmpA family protein [Bacteroidales bacterium]|nr:OmpA family protein [Bacteroidales bacterium]
MKDFKIKVILTTTFIFLAGIATAQLANIDELTPGQLKKYGKSASRAGDIYTAIFFYEKYRTFRANNDEVNYTLAELHRNARNYEKAAELYQLLAKKAGKKYPHAQFYHAQMLKSMGQYDEAIDEFTKYRRSLRGNKEERTYSKLVRMETEGCDSAKKIIQSPLNVSIENINSSVNGPHIEFSPIPFSDTMFIYASLRVDSLVYFTQENEDTERPVRQFYTAKKQGMDWIGGQLLEGPFNLPGVETGNGALSRDGNRFYFTRCAKNWQGKPICALYVSHKINNQWQKPEKLPATINDPNYTATQPALGRTAKTNRDIIYFVSDRPEGRGGLDIWYTVWDPKRNLYSKVRNLGSRINTLGDEMTPFYDPRTRNLFFSSTGLPGLGGLDIFSAFGERRKWSDIKNIGYPLNSSYDDLYFTVSRSGEDGFFVSNRPGGNSFNNETCCDDIYYYRWNEFINIVVYATIYPFEQDKYGRKKDLSNFDFMNPDASIKPLNDATIALYVQDKETKEYVFLDNYSTGEDGKFYFHLIPEQNYQFKMQGFQYFNSELHLSTEFFNFSDSIEMPPIWVNVLTDKPVVLENIYYEFNSAELSQRAKNVLDTTLLVMLKEAPEFIVEIGAHTDSIGDHEYNTKLSQDRANGVIAYLISKGISPERLVAKGYGAEFPIAPNKNPDGTDNPEGREKNRRTEFRIIGTLGEEEEDEDFADDN